MSPRSTGTVSQTREHASSLQTDELWQGEVTPIPRKSECYCGLGPNLMGAETGEPKRVSMIHTVMLAPTHV